MSILCLNVVSAEKGCLPTAQSGAAFTVFRFSVYSTVHGAGSRNDFVWAVDGLSAIWLQSGFEGTHTHTHTYMFPGDSPDVYNGFSMWGSGFLCYRMSPST